MAVRVAHQRLVPDLILVSPAERAWRHPPKSSPPAASSIPKQLQCARELYSPPRRPCGAC